MIEKNIHFSGDAKSKLKDGVDKLADAVKETLGAAGKTVILEDDFGRPHVTKDGVTVAKSINLSDPVEHLGASILKQASIKTADEAGDGTTTSIVVAQGIIDYAYHINDVNVTSFKNELEFLAEKAIEELKKKSKEVTSDNLSDIATISANNDKELGEIIANAYREVGVDGIVNIEESMTSETYTKVVEGTRIKKGYYSPWMKDDKGLCVLKEPYVLISDKEVKKFEDIEKFLMHSKQTGRPLLIIADVSDGAMHLLNLNKQRKVIDVNVVAPEGVGLNRIELLDDLAVMTGAILISDDTGNDFSGTDASVLGEAEKSLSTDKETVITLKSGRTADAVKDRAEIVRGILAKKQDKVNDWHYKDRLSRLSGGVAAIYVGASTEVEMKEKKDRVEDAIHATRAALEEGVVAGGGIALFNAYQRLDSKYKTKEGSARSYAKKALMHGMTAPLLTIMKNADYDSSLFFDKMNKIRRQSYGLDVKKLRYGNMFDMGIIDPLKVSRNTIQNAVSVASTFLTTNCVISNKRA